MTGVIRDNPFLLPKRHSSARSEDEFSRKGVTEWVDALPIGDTNRLANELYGKLEWLNQSNIPPTERLKILDLLQTPLSFVLNTLKRSYIEGVFPLGAKARLDAEMRLEILIQAVIGYKVVLAQFHDDTITGFLLHKHTRSRALQSMLFYLGEILLHSYMVYQPCLDYVWLELHSIYYYSISNELHIEGSAARADDKQQELDITGLYTQILLLSLVNPYSLLRGEAEKVNNALVQWAASAELVPIKEPVWAKSFFLIDAKCDARPCAPNLCQQENIDVGWALITDNLELLLEEEIQAASRAHLRSRKLRPADAVSERLLNKLKSAWTQEIRPRAVRSNSSDMVKVISGLQPLYRIHGGAILTGGSTSSSGTGPVATKVGYEHIYPVLLDSDEIMVEDSLGTLRLQEADILGGSAMEVGHKECISTNKSENGYHLSWPENDEYGTHVGDIVEVSSLTGREIGMDGSLGVIRWMRVERPGFLGMGVELLNGLVEPVILQRKGKGAKQTESVKGFLYHESEDTVSLITPPFFVDEGDHFRLVTQGQRRPVALTHIMESTDSFVRFQFEQSPSL